MLDLSIHGDIIKALFKSIITNGVDCRGSAPFCVSRVNDLE